MTKKNDALTTVESAGALANVDFGSHSGAGKENMTSADQAIPFLSILQGLSKAIADPSQKVKGASPGMIMDSVSKQLYDAEEEGVLFLPCSSSGQIYVEWQGEPGSGTPCGRYAPNDPAVIEAKRKYEFNKLQLPNGNRLVETFYVVGMVLDEDYTPTSYGILAFKSTGIKPYKASFGELYKIPGNAPMYAFPIRITTVPETRPKGTAYNFRIMPAGYDGNVFKEGIPGCVILPDDARAETLWPMAQQLAADFASGQANIAYETEGGGGETTSEDEVF